MRYLASNFFTRFHSQRLMKTFKTLCMQNQRRKFEAIWRELEEQTTRHTREFPTEAWEGQQSVRGASRSPISFSEWINLHAPELEKWSQLYDTDGARYDIMTTNMSEVYNSMLKGVR